MKKYFLGFVAGILLSFFSVTLAASSIFYDVPGDAWYSTAINNLALKGIINGYPDKSFKPQNGVSRAEVTVMMNNLLTYIEGKDAQIVLEEQFLDYDYDFEVKYPSGWTVQKYENGEITKFGKGDLVKVTSPNNDAIFCISPVGDRCLDGSQGTPSTSSIKIDGKDASKKVWISGSTSVEINIDKNNLPQNWEQDNIIIMMGSNAQDMAVMLEMLDSIKFGL